MLIKAAKKLILLSSAVISVFLIHSSLFGYPDQYLLEKYNGYNLIMISINNVGTEHMSLYGYKRKTTPNLDKWAGKALVFEDVFSAVSWTLPVITSIFTSLYPYTHEIMDRYHGNLLDKSIKTLPEILKENNYKTAAFTGGLDNIKSFGHMRGFEVVDDNPSLTGFEVTLTQAKNWLSQNSGKKFFLFIQGYNAHPPFIPPEKFKGVFSNPKGKDITVNPSVILRGIRNSGNRYEAWYYPFFNPKNEKLNNSMLEQQVVLTQDDIDYLRDLYDEEILYTDYMVGRFLNSLGKDLLKKTIIVIFSEHGEMFAKHGRFGRAGAIRGTLYDEVMHVPLIIKIPQQRGRRIKGLVQLLDVMPTILEVLGIFSPQTIQGKSLQPLLDDNRPVNEHVYAGARYNFDKLMLPTHYELRSINESIRNCKWKLIHEVIFSKFNKNLTDPIQEDTYELYDLQSDPDELTNVIEDFPEVGKKFKEKLDKWKRGCIPIHTSTYEFPEDLIEDARKYGYW